MKLKLSEPGVAVSLLVHASLLALLIVNIPWLADKPADDAMPEAVPIETISQNDFNQIMKGEKSSKDVTKGPVTKADKIAQADEQHPEPAKPDAKQVTPPPPPPKPADPTPPVPTPPVPPQASPPPPPPPPVPEPPQRPDPTPPPPLPPEAPTPPEPTPVPPQRDPDAEVIKQATPPKPVPKPPEPPKRAEVKPPPLPPKPVPTPPQPPKVVEQKPLPKSRPVDKPDQMAKLLDQTADDAQPDAKPTPKPVHKPAPHAKPSAAEGTAEPSDQKAFDPTDISRILNSQPAGAPPSTGKQLSKVASRGATSGNAPKMSPTQSDALDGLLADQFKQCWSYLGLDHGRYIPEIKVSYAEDGSLQSEPQLLNRPADPGARSLAESALRAVRQCNPLHIPAQFAPFYDQWRSRILRFDPAEMAG